MNILHLFFFIFFLSVPPRVVARNEGEVQARAGEKAELECVAHGELVVMVVVVVMVVMVVVVVMVVMVVMVVVVVMMVVMVVMVVMLVLLIIRNFPGCC